MNWKGESSAGYMNDGAAFAITNAGQNIDRSNITCFRCGVQGHYANECTDQRASNVIGRRNDNNHRNSNGSSTHNEPRNETSTTMVTTGIVENEQDNLAFVFSQGSNMGSTNYAKAHKYHIPNDWILLDSQSTVDVFSNAMLLKDIHESESSMKIHCTVGVTATNLVDWDCQYFITCQSM